MPAHVNVTMLYCLWNIRGCVYIYIYSICVSKVLLFQHFVYCLPFKLKQTQKMTSKAWLSLIFPLILWCWNLRQGTGDNMGVRKAVNLIKTENMFFNWLLKTNLKPLTYLTSNFKVKAKKNSVWCEKDLRSPKKEKEWNGRNVCCLFFTHGEIKVLRCLCWNCLHQHEILCLYLPAEMAPTNTVHPINGLINVVSPDGNSWGKRNISSLGKVRVPQSFAS